MILIADDDNAVRMSISLALERAGYQCVAVSNERDAMDAVRRHDVRLAVLDMNLTLSTTDAAEIQGTPAGDACDTAHLMGYDSSCR